LPQPAATRPNTLASAPALSSRVRRLTLFDLDCGVISRIRSAVALSRYSNGRGSAGLGRALQVERGRVDAVALAGRPRSVVEDVAEMRAAVAAANLASDHAVAVVGAQLDALG